MTRYASIVATGRYVPERLVPNDELRERFARLGRPDVVDRLEAGSGILQRWYAPDDWATSDLALPAARRALARAGRDADEVDLLIVGTDTPDRITPATSTILQSKLGAKRAGTFDIGCACASFPTAVAAAAGMIAVNPGIRTVVVVGAYLMHRLADPEDPMIFFYGDGAGAAVIEPADGPGFEASAFAADGDYADHWGIPAGGTAEPASVEAVRTGRTRVTLTQRYPPEINERGWPALVRRLAAHGGFAVSGIDHAVFTQINRHTIETVCRELDLSPARAPMVMDRYGYTGSACVPMALDWAIEQGRITPGQRVVLVGAGVGYNMAGVSVRMRAGAVDATGEALH